MLCCVCAAVVVVVTALQLYLLLLYFECCNRYLLSSVILLYLQLLGQCFCCAGTAVNIVVGVAGVISEYSVLIVVLGVLRLDFCIVDDHRFLLMLL